LLVAPNGNILVSSEKPFGSQDAITSVREYDAKDGRLVRVMSPGDGVQFRMPRGLRFGPDGLLYCVARDTVVDSTLKPVNTWAWLLNFRICMARR
jgi:hypothetical protein